MFIEQSSPNSGTGVAQHVSIHPLCPLTASEITKSAQLITGIYPSNISLRFKTITLEEPPKAQLAPYLDAEHHGRAVGQIDRKAFVNYYIRNTVSTVHFISRALDRSGGFIGTNDSTRTSFTRLLSISLSKRWRAMFGWAQINMALAMARK